jgi:hypothetical protein
MLKIDVLYMQRGLKKTLFLKEIDRKRPFSRRKTPILGILGHMKTAIFLIEMSLK